MDNWIPKSPDIEKELTGGVAKNHGYQPSLIGLTDQRQIEALAPALPASNLSDAEQEQWCITYIETLVKGGMSRDEAECWQWMKYLMTMIPLIAPTKNCQIIEIDRMDKHKAKDVIPIVAKMNLGQLKTCTSCLHGGSNSKRCYSCLLLGADLPKWERLSRESCEKMVNK